MAHVFISYKSEDKAFSSELRQRLADSLLDPWMDENIPPSRKWQDELDQRLRDAYALVLVITPEAMKSEYVAYEWIFALGRGIEVIPIYLRTIDKFPYRLGDIHYIDFRQEYSWARLVARIQEIKVQSETPSQISKAIDALKSWNRDEREKAAETLGLGKYTVALPFLIETLQDTDHRVRIAAATAIGRIPADSHSVDALIQALLDEEHSVRIAVVKALGNIQDTSTIPGLVDALSDTNGTVRTYAAKALTKMGNASVPHLLEALRDENNDVRSAAAWALGPTKNKTAVSSLIEALDDSDSNVRSHAAGALGEIGDTTAIEKLVILLSDKSRFTDLSGVVTNNHRVNYVAAQALEKIGTPEALEAVKAWRAQGKDME